MNISLSPYRDFGVTNGVDRLFERMLGDFALRTTGQGETSITQWSPAVDIREDDEKYVVIADVPGVDTKDIEVTFEDGVLGITGERKVEERNEKEGYTRVERVYGKFSRQFRLPESADESKIKASGKNGVLEIEIPKKERAKPRRIEIK